MHSSCRPNLLISYRIERRVRCADDCAGNYQWTPLVLALQALACYLPFLFWLTMQQRSGINLRSLIESAKRATFSPDVKEQQKHMEFAARSLH